MPAQPSRIVIVGFGNVGQGLADVISARSQDQKAGRSGFKVVAVVDSEGAAVDSKGLNLAKLVAEKKRAGSVGGGGATAEEVMRDVEADALVELTPGTPDGEPATSHIRAAIDASMNVVTANKMPLALHYSELVSRAKRRGVSLLYSACVGGGLPLLEFGGECASAEPVDGIEGVVNATTNYILSEMEAGVGYDRALKRAQELGYAEPDPSFDLGGLDAACKIVILANHVMGTKHSLKEVSPLKGVEGVTQSRVLGAKSRGKAIRLVAKAGETLSVQPAEVGARSPLAATGRSHAVIFHCRWSGERTVTGSGAGSVTTSLGVLRDLLSLQNRMGRGAIPR
ncbi:MAG: homoserine dehydrogenase [Nitrososphaerota archaeon]|nr:homoserine dehydrogenase [Nitrososphaerota archaeon]